MKHLMRRPCCSMASSASCLMRRSSTSTIQQHNNFSVVQRRNNFMSRLMWGESGPKSDSSRQQDEAASSSTNTSATQDNLDTVSAVMHQRRSCKNFDTTKKIEQHTMDEVWKATIRSPTAFNLQCWTAVCIERDAHPEQHANVFNAALSQPPVRSAPMTVVFAGNLNPSKSAPAVLEQGLNTKHFRAAYGPNYLRMVYYMLHAGPMNNMGTAKTVLSELYSESTGTPLLTVPSSMQAYAWKQTMIPVANFVTACEAAGLSTCILEGIDETQMKKACGLPVGEWTIPCIVTVGYPAAEGAFHSVPSPRFEEGHFVSYGKYGATKVIKK